jgi:hypothetical protein
LTTRCGLLVVLAVSTIQDIHFWVMDFGVYMMIQCAVFGTQMLSAV